MTSEPAREPGAGPLPVAEARIPTDRAARYLEQLCRHVRRMEGGVGHRLHSRLSHGGAARNEHDAVPIPRRVEHTDTDGVIDYGTAVCTLSARDSTLILRLAADDHRTLRRVQDAMTRTLERVGRRDRLVVAWTAPRSPADPGSAAESPVQEQEPEPEPASAPSPPEGP